MTRKHARWSRSMWTHGMRNSRISSSPGDLLKVVKSCCKYPMFAVVPTFFYLRRLLFCTKGDCAPVPSLWTPKYMPGKIIISLVVTTLVCFTAHFLIICNNSRQQVGTWISQWTHSNRPASKRWRVQVQIRCFWVTLPTFTDI